MPKRTENWNNEAKERKVEQRLAVTGNNPQIHTRTQTQQHHNKRENILTSEVFFSFSPKAIGSKCLNRCVWRWRKTKQKREERDWNNFQITIYYIGQKLSNKTQDTHKMCSTNKLFMCVCVCVISNTVIYWCNSVRAMDLLYSVLWDTEKSCTIFVSIARIPLSS